MRRFVIAFLVLAYVFGSNILSAWPSIAYADEGCYGRGPMRSRPLPEMMGSRGEPRQWVHGGEGHRARLVSSMVRWKEQLGLTAEQVRTLRELRADFQKGAITRTSEKELAAVDLRGLLEQDKPDLTKVEEQMRKIALLRADQGVARIKVIQTSKAVLTPEQQEKFKQLSHASRMEHRGMGMMEPGMHRVRPTR
jgi:Spy/CpxP family protein refolding chaperone